MMSGVCWCEISGGGNGGIFNRNVEKVFLITFFRLNGLTVFELEVVFVGFVPGVGGGPFSGAAARGSRPSGS
jgi:hypothetical protein